MRVLHPGADGGADELYVRGEIRFGVKVPYLHSVVSASRATVKRMVKALMEEGRIEHRGSKKTGGYYLK